MPFSMARRIAGLSNGGHSSIEPHAGDQPGRIGDARSSWPASIGSMSLVGFSHQSISLLCIAAAAVPGSLMTCHSTRSKFTIFGPDGPFWRATLAAACSRRNDHKRRASRRTRSFAFHLNGPLPTISVSGLNASVLASRSGIMAHMLLPGLPRASGSSGEGLLQAELDGVVVGGGEFVGIGDAASDPNASRAPQRLMEATQSLRQHLLAVVPHQAVAQGELPGLAVVLGRMAGDHLRLGLVGIVDAIQRVEDHEPVVAR